MENFAPDTFTSFITDFTPLKICKIVTFGLCIYFANYKSTHVELQATYLLNRLFKFAVTQV